METILKIITSALPYLNGYKCAKPPTMNHLCNNKAIHVKLLYFNHYSTGSGRYTVVYFFNCSNLSCVDHCLPEY